MPAADRQRTVYELVDRIMEGALADWLRRHDAAHVSNRAMAALLSDEIGVTLAHDTIRRWLNWLEDEPNGEAA